MNEYVPFARFSLTKEPRVVALSSAPGGNDSEVSIGSIGPAFRIGGHNFRSYLSVHHGCRFR